MKSYLHCSPSGVVNGSQMNQINEHDEFQIACVHSPDHCCQGLVRVGYFTVECLHCPNGAVADPDDNAAFVSHEFLPTSDQRLTRQPFSQRAVAVAIHGHYFVSAFEA